MLPGSQAAIMLNSVTYLSNWNITFAALTWSPKLAREIPELRCLLTESTVMQEAAAARHHVLKYSLLEKTAKILCMTHNILNCDGALRSEALKTAQGDNPGDSISICIIKDVCSVTFITLENS